MNLPYQDALDYLYSYIDYGSERADRYSPEVFELERIKRLLASMGNPHESYLSIHIAGTKGKGSVAALIASCLQQAGYKTGLYTSPHLIDFRERIRVNGKLISASDVAQGVAALKPYAAREPGITTYELMTALAFSYFEEKGIEVGVFEVGLGGRLDSTNVLTPIVSVITSLSYDHTHVLGDTLAEIAAEKAGIIKKGVPVVSANQPAEAERVLQQIAHERGSPLEIIGRDWHYQRGARDLSGQSIRIWSQGEAQESGVLLRLPLLGDHQLENAVVAFAALKHTSKGGFTLEEDDIRRGFDRVDWPGRFQVLQSQPALVVDSAHNGASAKELRRTLTAFFPKSRVHMIFGASEDKDIEGMLNELGPVVSRVTFTRASHPRAAKPAAMTAIAEGKIKEVECIDDVREALSSAMEEASPEDVVLVTGSLFVVGEVLASQGEAITSRTEESV
ncbi:MAG: bifunctional folylpolyglutamate synthase/dihydrofolate synthase [Anaerolineales bacterium]